MAEWTGLAYFVTMFFLWLIPWEIKHADLYGMTVAFAIMYLLERENLPQKIFLSVTGSLLFWIEAGFALIPWNACCAFVLMTEYMQKRRWLQFFCYAAVDVLHCILQGILLHFIVKLMHRIYICKQDEVTKKELGLLLLPLFSVFVGRFILSFVLEVYLADTGQYIWNVHGEFEWLKIIYQVISFSVVLLTVVIYQKIRTAQQKEKEDMVMAQQMQQLTLHIREVEMLYANLRGLRHDIGNHLTVMETLLLKDEKEELRQYFKKLCKEFTGTKESMGGELAESGNPVTDIILAEKKRQAQAAGIVFTDDFHYPQGTNLDAFDISIILNNALANAIEAAEPASAPYVKIRSWRRKNAFLIAVENRFDKKLAFFCEGEFPPSTKRDGKAHGFGLANIRRVARKYCGDVELTQEKDCVRLSVMLMLTYTK